MKKKTQNQMTLIIITVVVISLAGFLLFRTIPTGPGPVPDNQTGNQTDTGGGTTQPQTCQELCQSKGYPGAVGGGCIQVTSCNTPDQPVTEGADFCGELEVCCCQS